MTECKDYLNDWNISFLSLYKNQQNFNGKLNKGRNKNYFFDSSSYLAFIVKTCRTQNMNHKHGCTNAPTGAFDILAIYTIIFLKKSHLISF